MSPRTLGIVMGVAMVALGPVAVAAEDAPASVVSEQTVPTEGRQVPIPFHLPYDPARIDASHTYNVRASIHAGGQTLFTFTSAVPVLTRGAPGEVAIIVQPVAPTAPGRSATRKRALEDTRWTLTELGGAAALPSAEKGRPALLLVSAGPEAHRLARV